MKPDDGGSNMKGGEDPAQGAMIVALHAVDANVRDLCRAPGGGEPKAQSVHPEAYAGRAGASATATRTALISPAALRPRS